MTTSHAQVIRQTERDCCLAMQAVASTYIQKLRLAATAYCHHPVAARKYLDAVNRIRTAGQAAGKLF
jgi:hypothetical protein